VRPFPAFSMPGRMRSRLARATAAPFALPAKRDAMRALNVVLLGLICVSFATGWIASFLALTEFGLHKWSSIAFVIVAGAHLALHWRRFVSSRLRPRRTPPTDRLVLAGRWSAQRAKEDRSA